MKYADMQAQWDAAKAAQNSAKREQWRAMQSEPALAEMVKALRETFGALTLDSLTVGGRVLVEMPLAADEWVEPWDRDCWGFGARESDVREQARVAAQRAQPRRRISTRVR